MTLSPVESVYMIPREAHSRAAGKFKLNDCAPMNVKLISRYAPNFGRQRSRTVIPAASALFWRLMSPVTSTTSLVGWLESNSENAGEEAVILAIWVEPRECGENLWFFRDCDDSDRAIDGDSSE